MPSNIMHKSKKQVSNFIAEQMLEQGPAATEEAASFSGKISFGGKKLRQSYDAVARFQLERRARNHEF